jgi:hypothetical protein
VGQGGSADMKGKKRAMGFEDSYPDLIRKSPRKKRQLMNLVYSSRRSGLVKRIYVDQDGGDVGGYKAQDTVDTEGSQDLSLANGLVIGELSPDIGPSGYNGSGGVSDGVGAGAGGSDGGTEFSAREEGDGSETEMGD